MDGLLDLLIIKLTEFLIGSAVILCYIIETKLFHFSGRK